MEAVRDAWTDERLDDLNHRVGVGFEGVGSELRVLRLEMRTEFAAVRSEMQAEFAAVRSEMKTEFAAVRAEMREEFAAVRSEMREEFAAVRSELGGQIAALNRTLLQIGGGALVTMVLGFTGIIVTMAVRL